MVQAAAVYVTSIGSNIVTLTVLHIFHIKNCDFGFRPVKVIQGQICLCQSKTHGCFQKSPPWGKTSYVTVVKIFQIKDCDLDL